MTLRAAGQRVILEVHPNAELHSAWSAAFIRKLAETTRTGIASVEHGIEQLVVVEDVDKVNGGLGVNPIRYPDPLLNAQIHVPVSQTAEKTEAAISVVDSENQRAHVVEDGRWIPVDVRLAADSVDGGSRAGVGGGNTIGRGEYRIRVASAKLLRAAIS